MPSLFNELHSKIRYKIILPFLGLTILVALAGSLVALVLTTKNKEERLTNQVTTVTRVVNDSIVERENANLDLLRQIVFAPSNPNSGAPAVPDALHRSDAVGLQNALVPFFRLGLRSPRFLVDRMIAVDRTGHMLVDLERNPSNPTDFVVNPPLDMSSSQFVRRALNASGEPGTVDKFAGLIDIPAYNEQKVLYFVTVAPVYREQTVVGAALLGVRADEFLDELANQALSNIVVVYNYQGKARYSTIAPEQLQVPNRPTPAPLLEQASQSEPADLSSLDLRPDTLAALEATLPYSQSQSVLDTVHLDLQVNKRDYRLAISPLIIQRTAIGYIAAGLSTDALVDTVGALQGPIMAVTVVFMVAIVGLGIYVARQITSPLEELVDVAHRVRAGDWRRRSKVQTRDEIGELSSAFNQMTGSLVSLYNRVLAESGQLAAIVDSIADGIVVCDRSGAVQMVNRATRKLLNLQGQDLPPARFSDFPLAPLGEGEQAFGPEQSSLLQAIGDRVVRVSQAPVMTADNKYLGDVYVLQDLTDEVNIDRAKTNFIGTISHEMRTPLTTLHGTADLLLRGMFGRLEERQIAEVTRMQQKVMDMTKRINNAIMIADIDAGALPFELEPLELQEVVEEAVWKLRNGIKEKGLTLSIDIPDDIPAVLADYDHFHTIIRQLVDNAQLYTDTGGIAIGAAHTGEFVQIDIADTGPGIDPAMHERIFERFERGTRPGEGIDSQERGIGLGLAIVKHLVERHGGRVWVTSTPGEGSVFSFTLRHANDMGSPAKEDTALGTAA